MKVLALGLLCLLATVVNSTPMKRNKRAVMTMAGGFPFGTGAFAGAGGGFAGGFGGWPMIPSPWDYTRPFMPVVPWPAFIPPRPWYEGENVCTTTKEVQDPKDLQEWFSDVSSPNIDYSHESEQCQGTGAKYVCVKRYTVNGESKMQLTKHECCHGFVRNPYGNGCVESTPTNQNQGGRNQDMYYFPQPTTTSSSRTGVENVRLQ